MKNKGKFRYFIIGNCNQPIKFWPSGKGAWIHRGNEKMTQSDVSGFTLEYVITNLHKFCAYEVSAKAFREFAMSERNSLTW